MRTPEEIKTVARERARAFRLSHPEINSERQRQWRIKNAATLSVKKMAWFAANVDKKKESNARYRAKHAAKIAEYRNRDESKARRREREKERRKTDPLYCIEMRLRARFTDAIRKHARGQKSASILTLVGCTVEELAAHLERQFLPGMSWTNRTGWDIDHIYPVSRFDLTREDEQRKCFHFTNLRPLWKLDNLRKQNKLPVTVALPVTSL